MKRLMSAVVAAVLATTALAGCATRPAEPTPTTQSPPSSDTASASTTVAPPTDIDIPRLGARSSLIELGLNADQTVEVPPVDEPLQAGWFTGAPKPGEPGPAVVLGHVNGGGQAGIFARLHELTTGDEILIQRADDTTARFTVTMVDQVPKTDFPTDEVYGNTPGPEIRLITCGGAFDKNANSYRDNIIVYATITP